MDTNTSQVLSSARSIIIVLPANPRLDIAASGLSLASSLEKSGKTISVICSTPMTVDLSRLVGVEKVTNQPGDKNLLVRFVNYDASGIDTVTYNVENNQFELIVTTKDGATPPTTQQVQLSYSGLSADVVLLIGSTDPNQFGSLTGGEIFQSSKLAYVGTTDPPGNLPLLFVLTDPTAASLSETIVKFIQDQGLPLDQDIAGNLLFGIETATNNFLSEKTTANSFEAAAVCLRQGAVRHSQEVREIRGGRDNQWRSRPDQRVPRPPRQFTPPVIPPVQTQMPQAPSPVQPPPAPAKQEPPSPEWLEPKIYTGRTIV